MVNRDTQAKSKDPPDTAPAMIERPKMSLAMWSAMKIHIMKQREKKKQEQEQDAAIERLRREQEHKREQDAMTLEEIKDQLARFERKLVELREEKHQLFSQLKKVLNEDENRRRAQAKEANEMVAVSHSYIPHGMNLGVPPPLYMPAQGQHILNRAPILYKSVPPPQNLIPPGAMKRPRSPSPPPQHTAYHQNFNFKTHMTTFNQKSGMYSTNQFYPHPSQGVSPVVNSPVSSALPAGAHPPTTASSYPSFPGQFGPSDQQGNKQVKHLAHPGYHLPHIPQQSFVNSLQQQIEQSKQENRFPEEKYYVQQGSIVPIRGQAMIQIQQPSSKTSGSIITGYPVRAQVSAPQHFQSAPGSAGPPQSHPHGTFVSQSGVSRMPYPAQPNQRYY